MASKRDERLDGVHRALETWAEEVRGGLPGPVRSVSAIANGTGATSAIASYSLQSEAVDQIVCRADQATQLVLRTYYQRGLPIEGVSARLGRGVSATWNELKCAQMFVKGALVARGFHV